LDTNKPVADTQSDTPALHAPGQEVVRRQQTVIRTSGRTARGRQRSDGQLRPDGTGSQRAARARLGLSNGDRSDTGSGVSVLRMGPLVPPGAVSYTHLR